MQHDDKGKGTLRPLATLRPDEWLDLAYTHGTPEGPDIKPKAYASALAASVERQHPTATLAAQLKDGPLAQHAFLTDCGKFLSDNPDFNIVTSNLNAIPEQTNVGGAAQPEQLVKGLQTLQRLHSLGASWEETATLLDNDLYSPHQLLAAGPTQLGELFRARSLPSASRPCIAKQRSFTTLLLPPLLLRFRRSAVRKSYPTSLAWSPKAMTRLLKARLAK